MNNLRSAPLTFWYGLPIVVLIVVYGLCCMGGVLFLVFEPNAEMGGLLGGPLLVGAAILGALAWLMFWLLMHKSRGSAWVYTIVTTLVYGILLAVLFAVLGHATDHKVPGWAMASGLAVAAPASLAVYSRELQGK